ncbi:MAG TPA: hypothetical protein VIG33_18365 [Pseudobdellovibrionaceae bacterium]|jgi:hypothetical protein
MATRKTKKKQDVLAKLFSKRDENILKATNWNPWEIEEELKRAKSARASFLEINPHHDLSIIDEHIDQLTTSLKIKTEKTSQI